MSEQISINVLQEINARRAERWHEGSIKQWNALEWAGAMCGEAGEAANAAKKLRRLELHIKSINLADRDLKTEHDAKLAVAKEVADTIIYGLILMSYCGVDAECVIRDVFNRKSDEYNFPERI